MKLSDLTSVAARILVCDDDAELIGLAKALAQGVSDLLGIGFPCGWREVETDRDADGVPMVRLVDQLGLAEPEEVRGIAIDMLRTADLVEAMRSADEARKEGGGVG